jgi:ferrochelatase
MDFTPAKIGVIVAALGTPDAPTPSALRRYLAQFLSDMRVIDLNPLLWQPLLRLGVLRRRPRRSAALYSNIWTEDGSPLLLYSQQQVEGLQARLGERYRVVLGMRYGSPSIAEAMAMLEREGIDRILIFSMFPQFSCSTTASIYDAANMAAGGRRCPLFHERKRTYPTLRFVPPYYAEQGYIEALKATIKEAVADMAEPPERYLFSFHGIPRRYVDEGDPYRRQCEITAGLLAQALNLPDDRWTIAFQSQFGREEWLQPYTEDVLAELGAGGVRSLLAVCPGFTADCLETIDEIGREGTHQFTEAGGEMLTLVPCLNAHPAWLDVMADLARRETQGWLDEPQPDILVRFVDDRADRLDRAGAAAGD